MFHNVLQLLPNILKFPQLHKVHDSKNEHHDHRELQPLRHVLRHAALSFSRIGTSVSCTRFTPSPSATTASLIRLWSMSIACTSRLAAWSVPHMPWSSVTCRSTILAPSATAMVVGSSPYSWPLYPTTQP